MLGKLHQTHVLQGIFIVAGPVNDLNALKAEVRSFTGKTFADSTKASYKTHLRTYLRFCFHFHLEPVPATQNTILCYIAFLARTIKPSSINNYVNIIRIMHLDAGMANPLEANFAVTNLKRGISRELGVPPEQKLPLTCEILLDLKKLLNFHRGKDISFWCACMLAFFGFLRKSTLLPKNLSNPGNDCVLRSDLKMSSSTQIVLNIR